MTNASILLYRNNENFTRSSHVKFAYCDSTNTMCAVTFNLCLQLVCNTKYYTIVIIIKLFLVNNHVNHCLLVSSVRYQLNL